MLNKQAILLAGVVTALVSGCSSYETRTQANNGYDYLDYELSTPLVVEGLDAPVYTHAFDIPALNKDTTSLPVGKDVDVRSPVQILPVVEGARVEEDPNKATVWFNAVNTKENMGDHVWTLLLNFLANYDVAPKTLDKSEGLMESEWFTFEQEFGSYWFKKSYKSKERYAFSLKSVSRGKAASLTVELLDADQWYDGDKRTKPLLEHEKRRLSIGMLNRVLVHALAQKQRENALDLEQQSRQIAVELGFDDNQITAWIANAKYEKVWQRLPEVFTLLNFSVQESEHNLGKYVLEYDAPSDDYWEEHGLKPFDLEDGKYSFQLGDLGDGRTSITIFDEKGRPLGATKVSQMYISFAELMRSEGKPKVEEE